MGMLNPRGRKTATEVRTSAAGSTNRLQTNSEYFSAMGWSEMSQMLLQNTQQYYDGEKKFKITGDLMAVGADQFMNITPDQIGGFYDFVPVDGTLPVDRFAQASLWKELLGTLMQVPELAQQYDVGGIFAWVSQLAGLKNINQFKVQVVPDDQLQKEADSGNVVSLEEMRDESGGRGEEDFERIPGTNQF